jgi:hypothetical protein
MYVVLHDISLKYNRIWLTSYSAKIRIHQSEIWFNMLPFGYLCTLHSISCFWLSTNSKISFWCIATIVIHNKYNTKPRLLNRSNIAQEKWENRNPAPSKKTKTETKQKSPFKKKKQGKKSKQSKTDKKKQYWGK